MLGYHHPPRADPLDQAPSPEQTPPLGTDLHPPGADTPPEQAPPPPVQHAGRYGQRAGGTHPTGMQSCTKHCILIECDNAA